MKLPLNLLSRKFVDILDDNISNNIKIFFKTYKNLIKVINYKTERIMKKSCINFL